MNILDDYKTVLIVGNGFDLSLKYPTSYSDFIASKYFKGLLSKENSLASYLADRKKYCGNWIDIEKELGSYAKVLAGDDIHAIAKEVRYNRSLDDLRKSFRDDFTSICFALTAYLKEIEKVERFNEGYDESHAYKLIKEIVYERKSSYVVSFNYTSFIEKVIHNINHNCTDFCIRHIHSSIKNDIVFGVQDSMELQREHVFLYKSHNKCLDVRGLPQILENADKIIFFGYSLGETDHSYFDDFFLNQTKKDCRSKSFVFHHYGQDAYDDIIWQLKTLTNNRTSYLNQYNDIQFKDSKQ